MKIDTFFCNLRIELFCEWHSYIKKIQHNKFKKKITAKTVLNKITLINDN